MLACCEQLDTLDHPSTRRQALSITACIPPCLTTDVPTRCLHRYPPQFASLPASTRHPSQASISKSPVNRVSAHTGTRPDLACMYPVSRGSLAFASQALPCCQYQRQKQTRPASTDHPPPLFQRSDELPSRHLQSHFFSSLPLMLTASLA